MAKNNINTPDAPFGAVSFVPLCVSKPTAVRIVRGGILSRHCWVLNPLKALLQIALGVAA